MQNNNIIKLLGLKDNIKVRDVKIKEKEIIIAMKLKKDKPCKCPYCSSTKIYYHDKRKQLIKDIPYNNKRTYFELDRVRYYCPNCKKKISTSPKFIIKNWSITNRLFKWILEEFKNIKSIKEIAEETGLSQTSILRYLENLNLVRKQMPEVLCIDEFKGDSGGKKYQVNIADGKNHEILDILPSREKIYLESYFSKIKKEEREKVKYFVSDMSKTFKEIHDRYFPKSTYLVDKYHYIRQINWALENVRKEEQKEMQHEKRVFFKRSRKLLSTQMNKLKEEEKIKVADMLNHSERIRKSYDLKETFYQFVLTSKNREEGEKRLRRWIKLVEDVGDSAWKAALKAIKNWKEGILNTFNAKWTNGYIEGSHNKIKTLKRRSFGMPNFEHFRTRILLIFS
ncbi:ISL3 family transposase [Streptococcus agalactiae]